MRFYLLLKFCKGLHQTSRIVKLAVVLFSVKYFLWNDWLALFIFHHKMRMCVNFCKRYENLVLTEATRGHQKRKWMLTKRVNEAIHKHTRTHTKNIAFIAFSAAFLRLLCLVKRHSDSVGRGPSIYIGDIYFLSRRQWLPLAYGFQNKINEARDLVSLFRVSMNQKKLELIWKLKRLYRI